MIRTVDMSKLSPSQTEQMNAWALVAEMPEVFQAIADFKRERNSGIIEIHVSSGGIAKVFGKPNKVYK